MSRSNSIWLSRSKQDRPIVVKRLEMVEFKPFKSVRECMVDISAILLQHQIVTTGAPRQVMPVNNGLNLILSNRQARADLAIDFCYITILLESVNCLLRIIPDHLQNMLCLKSRKKQLDQTYYATYNVVDDSKLVWMLLVIKLLHHFLFLLL